MLVEDFMLFSQDESSAMCNSQDLGDTSAHCAGVDQEKTTCCKDDLTLCKEKLEEAQRQSAEWERKHLLALADYDNFRRRSAKDMESIRLQAQSRVLSEMLAVLDNFDRAFESVPAELAAQFAGFDLIRKDLIKKLHDLGVQEMDNGASFNPEFHEALVQVPADEKHQAGSIVAVLQKGYLFKGSVLRHAKVSVAN